MRRSIRDATLWGLTLRLPQSCHTFKYKYLAIDSTYTERWFNIGMPHEILVSELVTAKVHAGLLGVVVDMGADIETEREDIFQFGDRV